MIECGRIVFVSFPLIPAVSLREKGGLDWSLRTSAGKRVSGETSKTTRETRVLQLQTKGQIVGAAGAFLLFDLDERMNQNATEGKVLNDISGSFPGRGLVNSFRACFSGLIGTLLAAESVHGLIMIACIKPT